MINRTRYIKQWFESEKQNKELTHPQISKTLNPKRLRGPSDADPAQVQRLHKMYSGVRKKGSRFLRLKAGASKPSVGLLIFWVLLERPLLLPDVSLLFVYMSGISCAIPQAFLPS